MNYLGRNDYITIYNIYMKFIHKTIKILLRDVKKDQIKLGWFIRRSNNAKMPVFFQFNYSLGKIQVITQAELFKTKQTDEGFLLFSSMVLGIKLRTVSMLG